MILQGHFAMVHMMCRNNSLRLFGEIFGDDINSESTSETPWDRGVGCYSSGARCMNLASLRLKNKNCARRPGWGGLCTYRCGLTWCPCKRNSWLRVPTLGQAHWPGQRTRLHQSQGLRLRHHDWQPEAEGLPAWVSLRAWVWVGASGLRWLMGLSCLDSVRRHASSQAKSSESESVQIRKTDAWPNLFSWIYVGLTMQILRHLNLF